MIDHFVTPVSVAKPVNEYLVHYGTLGPVGSLISRHDHKIINGIRMLCNTGLIIVIILFPAPDQEMITYVFISHLERSLVIIKQCIRRNHGHLNTVFPYDENRCKRVTSGSPQPYPHSLARFRLRRDTVVLCPVRKNSTPYKLTHHKCGA